MSYHVMSCHTTTARSKISQEWKSTNPIQVVMSCLSCCPLMGSLTEFPPYIVFALRFTNMLISNHLSQFKPFLDMSSRMTKRKTNKSQTISIFYKGQKSSNLPSPSSNYHFGLWPAGHPCQLLS